jgi:DNA helicase-2/ATP-dependent DNA helicase PcrA
MCANRLLIAAAGSGKTSLIVNEAIENRHEKILITTFTLANEQSIQKKFIRLKGYIPSNVIIQPWFSFLLEHGIRPYRFWDKRVDGLILVQQASGLRYNMRNGAPVYWKESDNFEKHYFDDNMDVYSDKLSKLVVRCNDNSNNGVINRLAEIFNMIYIDEVQDMAGWDLEIIKRLLKSDIRLTMVGDPRQTVYHTHDERKYSQYSDGKIIEFIQTECENLCEIDEQTLKDSYRNSTAICALSSKLYPEFNECHSLLTRAHEHTGIFFVRECDIQSYGGIIAPLQLRYDSRRKMFLNTSSMNFGISKGLEADHVLIYPTPDMLKWLNGEQVSFAFSTKAKLYVALTRAVFSIGIVVNDGFKCKSFGICLWEP